LQIIFLAAAFYINKKVLFGLFICQQDGKGIWLKAEERTYGF
jgi:hypothetical protein